MGFADKLKDLAKKAEDEAATHKDQLRNAVQKAEQAADQRTGGQYHEQIVKASEKASGYVERIKDPETPDTPAAQADVPPTEPGN